MEMKISLLRGKGLLAPRVIAASERKAYRGTFLSFTSEKRKKKLLPVEKTQIFL